jgi:uncharacterized membrane protein
VTPRRVTVERNPVAVHRVPGGAGTLGGPGGERRGEVRAIMARQARTALFTLASAGSVLVGLPVAMAFLPGSRVWLAVSLAVQPFWVLLAVRQLRRAERVEEEARDAGARPPE